MGEGCPGSMFLRWERRFAASESDTIGNFYFRTLPRPVSYVKFAWSRYYWIMLLIITDELLIVYSSTLFLKVALDALGLICTLIFLSFSFLKYLNCSSNSVAWLAFLANYWSCNVSCLVCWSGEFLKFRLEIVAFRPKCYCRPEFGRVIIMAGVLLMLRWTRPMSSISLNTTSWCF